jgi:hypothetical protein
VVGVLEPGRTYAPVLYNKKPQPILKMVKAYTTNEAVEKFKEIHGDTYDYSHVEYVNNSSNIEII